MRVRQADWSAQTPWSGIQDIPAFLASIETGISISDVTGLQAALDAAGGGGSGTIAWNKITGKPSFGSAAYVPVSAFLSAWTEKTLQVGNVPFVMGQQSYDVTFTATMKEVPYPFLQVYMTDGTAEHLFASVVDESRTEDGFTFNLSSAPALSTGFVRYRAAIENQP